MSKTPRNKGNADAEEMRSEYRLDYTRAKPNRFAERLQGDVVAVVLEPDVASVFGSSAQVNALLRSVISALPTPPNR